MLATEVRSDAICPTDYTFITTGIGLTGAPTSKKVVLKGWLLSVSVSVCRSLRKRLNRSRCRLEDALGRARGTFY